MWLLVGDFNLVLVLLTLCTLWMIVFGIFVNCFEQRLPKILSEAFRSVTQQCTTKSCCRPKQIVSDMENPPMESPPASSSGRSSCRSTTSCTSTSSPFCTLGGSGRRRSRSLSTGVHCHQASWYFSTTSPNTGALQSPAASVPCLPFPSSFFRSPEGCTSVSSYTSSPPRRWTSCTTSSDTDTTSAPGSLSSLSPNASL